MALQYDLTSSICSHLDQQLLISVLEYLQYSSAVEGNFSKDSLAAAITQHKSVIASTDAILTDDQNLDAEYMYASGRFDETLNLLTNVEPTPSSAFGILACRILTGDIDGALAAVESTRVVIDASEGDDYSKLSLRTRLCHWALFACFQHDSGMNAYLDLTLFRTEYMNAIQLQAPYLIRYVTAASLLNRSRKSVLGELRKVIGAHADPITEFFHHLFVEYNYEQSKNYLTQFSQVTKSDIFLSPIHDLIRNQANIFFFEMYARVHSSIEISLVKALTFSDDPHAWILDVMKSARIDVSINGDTVLINLKHQTRYQNVLEVSKNLDYQTSQTKSAVLRSYAHCKATAADTSNV